MNFDLSRTAAWFSGLTVSAPAIIPPAVVTCGEAKSSPATLRGLASINRIDNLRNFFSVSMGELDDFNRLVTTQRLIDGLNDRRNAPDVGLGVG